LLRDTNRVCHLVKIVRSVYYLKEKLHPSRRLRKIAFHGIHGIRSAQRNTFEVTQQKPGPRKGRRCGPRRGLGRRMDWIMTLVYTTRMTVRRQSAGVKQRRGALGGAGWGFMGFHLTPPPKPIPARCLGSCLNRGPLSEASKWGSDLKAIQQSLRWLSD